ncbi:MAG: glycoside hydrolase family 43 protein [Roseburia sp.]|nr:glycoside hydrolase family 43 protein [Roseburia sp.]
MRRNEEKMSVIAKNPIMPGFYPDPSLCAVGEDYYLVNSTFAYFPGLPVLHSRDLAHWEQIGNVLDRASQLPLERAGHSQGLFAPVIRYYDGTFYVICTNVSHGGNFVVTATNPAGPWSEPYYIEGADGIDPSLFFDEDGVCYYIGTHPNPEGCRYDGDWFIWIQELDIQTMKLVGEKKNVWNGAMRGVIWPEGPHLYHIGDYYYIMHAEGGTGPEHCVAVCRSRNIWGPYENYRKNPVLTHRHLGKAYPIQYVGHGDILQTPAGEWYMAMLAVRPLEGYTTMGRETFLARVTWEDGWPVVNPGVGMLTDELEINLDSWQPDGPSPGGNRSYDFTGMKELGAEFLRLRNPGEDMYCLTEAGLYLKLGEETLKEQASPSYIAIRQTSHNFTAKVKLQIKGLADNECAGIALMQNDAYHLRVEANEKQTKTILCKKGEDILLGSSSAEGREALELAIRVEGLKACVLADGQVIADADVRELSTETAGGFVGCTVGMYASANGVKTDKQALFTSFCYEV